MACAFYVGLYLSLNGGEGVLKREDAGVGDGGWQSNREVANLLVLAHGRGSGSETARHPASERTSQSQPKRALAHHIKRPQLKVRLEYQGESARLSLFKPNALD
jgi:hypothetical protein